MKQTKRLLPLLLTATLVIVAEAPVRAQQQDAAQTPITTDKGFEWLKLARQIIRLNDTDPLKDEDISQEERNTLDAITKLLQQLHELPDEQIAQAYRFMLANSSNTNLQSTATSTLLAIAPSAENVRYVLPFFQKLPGNLKLGLLTSPIYDAIMLRPEVPEFREFPLAVLQEGARRKKMSSDLISQAALLLVVRTSATEKKAMHEALAHHPEAGGVWNALTQLQSLTTAEVQKARQMFVSKRNHFGWRMTFAVALSPYDPKMREIVRQAVEVEMKDKADFDFTGILMKQRPDLQQTWQLQDKARPAALALLRFWELKQALPYLQRILRAKNPMVRRLAMPTLAMRAPLEVLRVASAPNSRKTIMHRKYGLALTGLLHPQLQPQAAQLLAEDYDKKEGLERVKENFKEVAQELRNKGVLSAF